MSAAPPHHREAGLTLLEVLVSLALAALIFSIVLTTLRTGLTAYRGQVTAAGREDMLERAFAVTAGDLARCLPVVDPAGQPHYVFSGRSSDVVCLLPERAAAGGGFIFLNLTVQPDGKGGSLLLRRRAPVSGTTMPAPDAWRDAVALISGPFTIRFAFGQGRAGLMDDWSDPQRMPETIELRVSEAATGIAATPPLAVRIMADAEPECSLGAGPACRLPSGRIGGGIAQ